MAGDPSVDLTATAVAATAVRRPSSTAGPRGPVAALRRIAVAVTGTAIVLVGLVLVPLPGPGWAIVFSGVALLGTEFTWAARLLHAVLRRLAPVTAAWERVPRVVRRVVAGLGIAVAVTSVGVSLIVVAR